VEFVGYYAAMAGNTRTMPVSPAWLRGAAAVITPLSTMRGEPFDLGGFVNFLTGRITYSMERAKTRLGWQARVPLAEGMAQAERWLRQRGLL
jgi:nucleoside-diphosphate-sugar epimerase